MTAAPQRDSAATQRLFAPLLRRAVESVSDAVAVFAPSDCVGCGRADRALCSPCTAPLRAAEPHRAERFGRTVWCGADYEGVVRRALLAYKDDGRTEMARVLAVPLRSAIAAALAEHAAMGDHGQTGEIELATIPSAPAAFRQRGFHPVNTLLGAAGLRAASVLRLDAAHHDQVGLGRDARRRNLSGAISARTSPWASTTLRGRRFLVIDDILTTGSTITEAARALRVAGAEVCGLVVLADTKLKTAPQLALSNFI